MNSAWGYAFARHEREAANGFAGLHFRQEPDPR
jgi:hypothetical protein